MALPLTKIEMFNLQNLRRKAKTLKRWKKILASKNAPRSFNITKLNENINNCRLKLIVRVTPNNVFCTLIDVTKKQIIYNKSAGIFKIPTSKKKIKFTHKIIILKFLSLIKSKLGTNLIVIKIIGPIKIRKSIVKCLSINLKRKNVILHTKPLKCFNGCRPAKKRRKKQKGLRIFK